MAQVIALTDDARQTFRTVLDGQSIRITAWWQPSTEAWYATLQFVGGDYIASGLRLTARSLILEDFVSDFRGCLWVDGDGEPGRHAWSAGSHRLLFLAAGELP